MRRPEDVFIIVGCEESQAITKAFRARGFMAFSCDLKPSSGGLPSIHFQEDIRIVTQHLNWDAGIFHPDCTYMTVTGNKWMKDQPARKSGALVGAARRQAREEAIDFTVGLYNNTGIPNIGIENPIGCLSSRWRKPDQIFQPMDFGHEEPKKTCLWLKGFPVLVPTHTGIEGKYHTTASGKRLPHWYAYADKSEGQSARAAIRSQTFSGIAEAIAQQWGDYLLTTP
jgi:hypothetical protein